MTKSMGKSPQKRKCKQCSAKTSNAAQCDRCETGGGLDVAVLASALKLPEFAMVEVIVKTVRHMLTIGRVTPEDIGLRQPDLLDRVAGIVGSLNADHEGGFAGHLNDVTLTLETSHDGFTTVRVELEHSATRRVTAMPDGSFRSDLLRDFDDEGRDMDPVWLSDPDVDSPFDATLLESVCQTLDPMIG